MLKHIKIKIETNEVEANLHINFHLSARQKWTNDDASFMVVSSPWYVVGLISDCDGMGLSAIGSSFCEAQTKVILNAVKEHISLADIEQAKVEAQAKTICRRLIRSKDKEKMNNRDLVRIIE